MSKDKKQQKKEPFLKTNERADGTTEFIVTKAPQKTVFGKIIIVSLAFLLGLGTILSLIFVLAQL